MCILFSIVAYSTWLFLSLHTSSRLTLEKHPTVPFVFPKVKLIKHNVFYEASGESIFSLAVTAKGVLQHVIFYYISYIIFLILYYVSILYHIKGNKIAYDGSEKEQNKAVENKRSIQIKNKNSNGNFEI